MLKATKYLILPITMGLLYTSSWWGTLTSSFCCKLFSWSFTTSGFTSCLLGTSHFSSTV